MKDNREKAVAFIEDIRGSSLTNINEALLTALKGEPDPKRPRIIVFLTDGRPTIGITQESEILRNVAEANANQSRIFVFGVGYDVNVRLLDRMAEENGGTRHYVEPNENLEIALVSFFSKINEPVLANLELDFGAITTKAVCPENLPNLFRAEQITLLGRYQGHGDTVLKLRGDIGGERYEFSQNVQFPESESDHDFLPNLWAQRSVAALTDKLRLSGDNAEIRCEITRLCGKYGVIAPYISFVEATDNSLRRPIRINVDRFVHEPMPERIDSSKHLQKQKAAQRKRHYKDTKYVGRKAFHHIGGIWIDTEYDDEMETHKVAFNSNTHHDLMDKIPELKKYFKLANSVIVCYRGTCYQITPN